MKVELTKASSRGQVVIPKEIRDKIDLQEGTLFAVSFVSGIVLLKRVDLEKEFDRIHKWGTILARNKRWKEADLNKIVHEARNSRE